MMVVANVSIYIAVKIFGPPPDTSGEYKNKEGAKILNTYYYTWDRVDGWVPHLFRALPQHKLEKYLPLRVNKYAIIWHRNKKKQIN